MVSLVVTRTSRRKFDYKQQADGSTPMRTKLKQQPLKTFTQTVDQSS